MKYAIICLLLLTSLASQAQYKVQYIYSHDSLHAFMLVDSKERHAVAQRINASIQADWGYDPKAKDPFENAPDIEAADFNFDAGANNDRVLSLIVEYSYSAAGLHITRHEYHFDSKTGMRLDMNKVFGADGLAKLHKALNRSWKAALKSAADDKSDSRADEYKACLADYDGSDVRQDRMMIDDQGMRFWAGSCLEGTAYDFEADRSQGPHMYSLGQLLPMLTQYGFSLFVDKSTAPLQILMRGTVDGKYPVSFTLLPGKDAGTVSGMLVYDRVGEPLNLGGTMNGNQLKFHELDAAGNAVSDIEVSWNGTKLTGSFINLKSKKQMAFEAAVAK